MKQLDRIGQADLHKGINKHRHIDKADILYRLDQGVHRDRKAERHFGLEHFHDDQEHQLVKEHPEREPAA